MCQQYFHRRIADLRLLLGLAGLAVVLALTGCKPREPQVKFASILPADHSSSRAMLHLKKRLEELSGGTIHVDLFFNGQLGSADEALELMRMGDLELSHVSASNLSVYVPLVNALTMPFIFNSREHQFRVLEGEPGQIITREVEKYQLEILGFLDSGTRNITTKQGPITRPEDLKGKKIRVMTSPVMVKAINALGASATPLNMGEVFTALQMGVIDGWENNPMTIVTYKMFETGCVYYAWTHHFCIPDMIVAGEPFLKRLTPQQREWVNTAVDETVQLQRRLWIESEEEALATMVGNGMKINKVDIELFRNRVRPVYDEAFAQYGPRFRELCEMIIRMP